MIFEQHENLAISIWLKRWIKRGIRIPKITVCVISSNVSHYKNIYKM